MNREEAAELHQRKRDLRLQNLERKRTEDDDWDPDEDYYEEEDDS